MKYELIFAKAVGVPLKEDSKFTVLYNSSASQKNFNVSAEIDIGNFNKISDNHVLSTASFSNFSKLESNNASKAEKAPTPLKRHRMIVIMNFIKDLPENLDKSKNYYLEYFFFDQQIKYKLDFNMVFQKGNSLYVALNKIKLFYFFSEDHKEVNNFLKLQNVRNF